MYDYQTLYQLFIDKNLSIKEISVILKCSTSTVTRYLKKLGITKSRKLISEKHTKNMDKEIASLFESGFSNIEISNKLNLYRNTVARKLKNLNLERNLHLPSGKIFGILTIIEPYERKYKQKVQFYKCECRCGNIFIANKYNLTSGKTLSCGCIGILKKKQDKITIYDKVPKLLWKRLIYEAKIRKLEFSVSIEYLNNLFEKQNKKCIYTGLELIMPVRNKSKNRPHINDYKYIASLDRIDSSKGYIEGNVQWVCIQINLMKRDYSESEFIKLCKLVSENK